jgi:hypothetical protein
MKSLTLAIAAATLALIATPVFAACADDVKNAEMAVMKMTDAEQKKMAMMHLDMAKKAMMEKKDADCMKEAMMAKDAPMMKDGMMKDGMKKQ